MDAIGAGRLRVESQTNFAGRNGLVTPDLFAGGRGAGCCVVFAAVALVTPAQQGAALHGSVADSTGSAIEGAQIEYRSPDGVILAKTDASGNFSIAETGQGGTLRISFPGFAAATLEVKPHSSVQKVQIVLTPAANIERLQVKSTVEDRIPRCRRATMRFRQNRWKWQEAWRWTMYFERCRASARSGDQAVYLRTRHRRACRSEEWGRARRAGRACCWTGSR